MENASGFYEKTYEKSLRGFIFFSSSGILGKVERWPHEKTLY